MLVSRLVAGFQKRRQRHLKAPHQEVNRHPRQTIVKRNALTGGHTSLCRPVSEEIVFPKLIEVTPRQPSGVSLRLWVAIRELMVAEDRRSWLLQPNFRECPTGRTCEEEIILSLPNVIANPLPCGVVEHVLVGHVDVDNVHLGGLDTTLLEQLRQRVFS